MREALATVGLIGLAGWWLADRYPTRARCMVQIARGRPCVYRIKLTQPPALKLLQSNVLVAETMFDGNAAVMVEMPK